MENQREVDGDSSNTPFPRIKFILSLVALCAINISVAFEFTAIPLALPTISQALNANAAQVFWIGTSFVVASATIQPIFATLANPFGRKPLVLVGLVFLILGSILCAVSQNVVLMLVGRCLQGVGAGGLSALTYTVLVDLFPLKDRTKGISLIAVVRLVGLVAGPIVGGVLAEAGAWRWIFWIILPLGGGSFILAAGWLETPHEASRFIPGLRQVDWIGSVLFVSSLSAFLVALSWGGVIFEWASWPTLVPLCMGAMGVALWVAYDQHVARRPMISMELLWNRTAGPSFLNIFFLGLIQFAILYYLPLYFEFAKGYSPIISGVALLPQCICQGILGATTGQLIPRIGRYKLVTVAGYILLTVGCGILVLLGRNTAIPAWIFLNVPSALGLGIVLVSQPIAAQAASSKANMTMAASLTPFFRTIGQALGIVIGGAVFQNRFVQLLSSSEDESIRSQAKFLAKDFVQLSTFLDTGLDERGRHVVRDAFAGSTHTIWWCLLAVSAFCVLASLVIEDLPLSQKAKTNAPSIPPEKV